MHDIGLSAWWAIGYVIPVFIFKSFNIEHYLSFYNIDNYYIIAIILYSIIGFYIALKPGSVEANQYGDPPVYAPPRSPA
jgi:uncharacterized membrane protein YhaH (DUF805 family)